MIGIGETPTYNEVREQWVNQVSWAFEPKTDEVIALNKTDEELAGEAFDDFMQEYLSNALRNYLDNTRS